MDQNNSSENAFSEIVKKLTPRLLAIILIVALVALTLVISFALYRGGSVSLKKMEFSAPNSQDQEIENLMGKINDCENKTNKLTEQLKELEKRPKKIELDQCNKKMRESVSLEKIGQIIGIVNSGKEALSEIRKLKKNEDDYGKFKENFSFKLFLLEMRIPQYGKAIPTHYEGNNSSDTYKLLQEILRDLGFYKGKPDGRQESTRNAIIAFQEAYNEKLKNEAELDNGNVDKQVLQPLGYVGYRTLEAFRSWYRKNAA